MDRRRFLKLGLGVGTALVAAGCRGADPAVSEGASSTQPVVNDTPADSASNEAHASGWNAPSLIACAGDSLTYGFGVEDTRDIDSYPAQLQALLTAEGVETRVENYGLNGACALSSGKNPYTDFAEYYDSLDAGADLVILMLGTNDAASVYWDQVTYEDELAERVASYLATTASTGNATQVMLMVPPNIISTEWAGGVPAGNVDEMQVGARNVAARMNLTSVDLEPIFAGHDDLFADGVHPNAAGNALIAQAVLETLHTIAFL